jgi:ATP-dependent DNA helicase RecG
MPQNNVVIEYRMDPASIQFDDRIEIQQPLFLAVETIWAYINQPSLNRQMHISEGAYIFDIKLFNEKLMIQHGLDDGLFGEEWIMMRYDLEYQIID